MQREPVEESLQETVVGVNQRTSTRLGPRASSQACCAVTIGSKNDRAVRDSRPVLAGFNLRPGLG
jgi:hypothetical protein